MKTISMSLPQKSMMEGFYFSDFGFLLCVPQKFLAMFRKAKRQRANIPDPHTERPRACRPVHGGDAPQRPCRSEAHPEIHSLMCSPQHWSTECRLWLERNPDAALNKWSSRPRRPQGQPRRSEVVPRNPQVDARASFAICRARGAPLVEEARLSGLGYSQTRVPKIAPIPAVNAIASAPQKVTRTTGLEGTSTTNSGAEEAKQGQGHQRPHRNDGD